MNIRLLIQINNSLALLLPLEEILIENVTKLIFIRCVEHNQCFKSNISIRSGSTLDGFKLRYTPTTSLFNL